MYFMVRMGISYRIILDKYDLDQISMESFNDVQHDSYFPQETYSLYIHMVFKCLLMGS